MRTLIIIVVVLIMWETLSSLQSYDYYFPAPSLILASFKLPMLYALLITIIRALVGFIIGVALSYLIMYPLWLMDAVGSSDDQFSAARTVPIIAATPLLIMWFGFGETARVIVVALSVLAFTIGPLAEASNALSQEFKVIRKISRQSKKWEFLNVIVPGTLSDMIGPLRVSFAIAYVTAVAVDFMGSTVGVGRVIDSARVTFNVPVIFLMLIVSGITGIVADRALKKLLRSVCHWRGRATKS